MEGDDYDDHVILSPEVVEHLEGLQKNQYSRKSNPRKDSAVTWTGGFTGEEVVAAVRNKAPKKDAYENAYLDKAEKRATTAPEGAARSARKGKTTIKVGRSGGLEEDQVNGNDMTRRVSFQALLKGDKKSPGKKKKQSSARSRKSGRSSAQSVTFTDDIDQSCRSSATEEQSRIGSLQDGEESADASNLDDTMTERSGFSTKSTWLEKKLRGLRDRNGDSWSRSKMRTHKDFTVDHFRELERSFFPNERVSLNPREFEAKMEKMVDMPAAEVRTLFDKIDVNGSERINKSQVLSYLFHEEHSMSESKSSVGVFVLKDDEPQYEYASLVKSRLGYSRILHIPELSAVCVMGNNKNTELLQEDSFKKICSLPAPAPIHKVCVTPRIAVDKYNKYLENRNQGGSGYHLYASDVAYSCHLRQVLATTLDRSITLYQIKRKLSNDRSQELITYAEESGWISTHRPPSCLNVTQLTGLAKPEILVYGDVAGAVTVVNTKDIDHTIKRIPIHSDIITKTQMLPDESFLITTSWDGGLSVVNPDSMRVYWSCQGHDKGIYSFTYIDKSNSIATCAADRNVHIWNPNQYWDPKPLATLSGNRAGVVEIIANEDFNQLMTICLDKTIKVWDLRMLRLVQSFRDPTVHNPDDQLSSACFDYTRRRLLAVGSHLTVWPLDKKSGTVSGRSQKVHIDPIAKLLYSRHFGSLVSVGIGGDAHVFDASTGRETFSFKTGLEGPITQACLDFQGRSLILGTFKGQLRRYNFNSGELLYTYRNHGQLGCEVIGLCCAPAAFNYGVMAVFVNGHTVFWPNIPDSLPLRRFNFHNEEVCSFAMHPNGETAYSIDVKGKLVVWSLGKAAKTSVVDIVESLGREIRVQKSLVMPRQNLLLLVADDGKNSVHLLDIRRIGVYDITNKNVCQFGDYPVTALALNHYGTRLFVGDCKGWARIYFLENFGRRGTCDMTLVDDWLPHSAEFTDCIWVGDKELNRFFTGAFNGTLSSYDEDGNIIGRVGGMAPWEVVKKTVQTIGAFSSAIKRSKERKKVAEHEAIYGTRPRSRRILPMNRDKDGNPSPIRKQKPELDIEEDSHNTKDGAQDGEVEDDAKVRRKRLGKKNMHSSMDELFPDPYDESTFAIAPEREIVFRTDYEVKRQQAVERKQHDNNVVRILTKLDRQEASERRERGELRDEKSEKDIEVPKVLKAGAMAPKYIQSLSIHATPATRDGQRWYNVNMHKHNITAKDIKEKERKQKMQRDENKKRA